MKNKLFKENKRFWQSKTFWVNLLIISGGISTALAGELQAGGALTAVGVVNIGLRVVTEKGISF